MTSLSGNTVVDGQKTFCECSACIVLVGFFICTIVNPIVERDYRDSVFLPIVKRSGRYGGKQITVKFCIMEMVTGVI